MNLYYHETQSPVGKLKLVANDTALVAVLWENDTRHQHRLAAARRSDDHPILQSAQEQLAEYFAGRRTHFTVPLRPEGTDFQQRVWQQLRAIPFGDCRSYGDLARAIGQPTAARAVGAANGCNPISIIVPCHRVIGSNGQLTGFAGGMQVKAYLIAHEQRHSGKLGQL
jgi:methylated-DNA-[protein]-cysteine S-methyltransferase